jgi:aspartate carbamoyltransferase catalytic subunit
MTRIQRERFPDPEEYEKVKNSYVLRNYMLDASKPNCRVLHPLPRVNEIHVDVDANPKAYYFQQAQNGVYARQALIASILGLK